jgi:hypothetical protein
MAIEVNRPYRSLEKPAASITLAAVAFCNLAKRAIERKMRSREIDGCR